MTFQWNGRSVPKNVPYGGVNNIISEITYYFAPGHLMEFTKYWQGFASVDCFVRRLRSLANNKTRRFSCTTYNQYMIHASLYYRWQAEYSLLSWWLQHLVWCYTTKSVCPTMCHSNAVSLRLYFPLIIWAKNQLTLTSSWEVSNLK